MHFATIINLNVGSVIKYYACSCSRESVHALQRRNETIRIDML